MLRWRWSRAHGDPRRPRLSLTRCCNRRRAWCHPCHQPGPCHRGHCCVAARPRQRAALEHVASRICGRGRQLHCPPKPPNHYDRGCWRDRHLRDGFGRRCLVAAPEYERRPEHQSRGDCKTVADRSGQGRLDEKNAFSAAWCLARRSWGPSSTRVLSVASVARCCITPRTCRTSFPRLKAAQKNRPSKRVPRSAGFAIRSPRGIGDPHDSAPRGSQHLSCVRRCTAACGLARMAYHSPVPEWQTSRQSVW